MLNPVQTIRLSNWSFLHTLIGSTSLFGFEKRLKKIRASAIFGLQSLGRGKKLPIAGYGAEATGVAYPGHWWSRSNP